MDRVLEGRSGAVYYRGALPGGGGCQLGIVGDCGTGEIFVQVTRMERRWVEAFASQVPDLRPAERRDGIRWPDLEAAFAVAEALRRKVIRRPGRVGAVAA